ncbi:MAG: glycosyl hydrolase, partial [Candidatus Aminicenantes bacterium]|nr:glycosyl hydrolase [Candidatus Aminicenantes bacterium]
MKSAKFLPSAVALSVLLVLSNAGCRGREKAAGIDTSVAGLEQGFLNPPDEARPWVYWFIMDGNFSREGVTADLEAMRRVGIGGAILMEVDVGIPRGPVGFMSPEWRAIFKHAVSEAERLGLELTLNAGPGWTGSGGPWVKPEESMQHLVAASVDVSGPGKYASVLPRPEPRPPYFGSRGLPAELQKMMREFCLDVAVLAVPKTPAGLIADLDEKALYLRHPYSSKPGTKPHLISAEPPAATPPGATIPRNRVIDLTDRLQADGRLEWDVPSGEWTILRFGRTSNGANTRPAPLAGLGLECDKFDRAALDAHFAAYIDTLLADLGPLAKDRRSGWTMLHIDSWEMGAQNWSREFRAEFQRRRGYDLWPFLPAYTGRIVESADVTERFLWDLRQTAQELVIENHAVYLKELGRRYGFGLSIEPYDMNPCADLSLGAVADVPMGEFWADGYGFNTAYSVIEAVSVAHTNGRPLVAAESFTAERGEAWRLHPGVMKPQADWAFSMGLNRLVFHRYAHQPWLDRRPGMTMGPYGVHYERTQTWWEMAAAWHLYLSRCQFMLRRGLPVADICYLTPEGAPHVFVPPPSALSGRQPVPNRRGYNFDGCAPEVLLTQMKVRDGRLVLPAGMSYSVLVVPEVEAVTPALLKKIKELVEAGATVIGSPPERSPSLAGYPDCDQEVARLAAEIWAETASGSGARGRVIRTARPPEKTAAEEPLVLYGDYDEVAAVLAGMGIPPDFESEPALRYNHRREGETDIYFVANPLDSWVEASCVFRVSGKSPSIWDPLTGKTWPASPVSENDNRIRLTLSLEPHGSRFVVFR